MANLIGDVGLRASTGKAGCNRVHAKFEKMAACGALVEYYANLLAR
jgi:hypothetical protein